MEQTVYRVLGAVEVVVGGTRLAIGGPKQRAVLSALVLHADRPVDPDRVVEMVWGPSAGRGSRGALHTYISNLRAIVPDPILRSTDGYLLEAAPDSIDAVVFERACRRSVALCDSDSSAAAAEAEHALSLWRGEPYSNLDAVASPAAEIRRLIELHTEVTALWIDLQLACGRHDQVISDLARWVDEHPFDERFAGQLMLALYRSGRQADALATFERTRLRLLADLGVDPGPELRELEHRILRHDHDLQPTAGADVLLLDGATGVSSDIVASVRRSSVPAVPVTNTSFVGREDDVDRVREALATGRLVTITGTGGVGKTRLAAEAVRADDGLLPDTVHWVELAAAGTQTEIESIIAEASGVRLSPASSAIDVLALAFSELPVLLVLDNCEHILDDVFTVVDRLLATSPELRVLATSREPLTIDGEIIVALRPLSVVPESSGGLAPAVELFVARATSGGASQSVAMKPVVPEICRRLDGLPLALELAARLVRSMTLEEIRDGLDERFQLLVGPRGRSDRHRTLWNALRWSTELLDDADHDLLRSMACFGGSFAASELAAVVGVEELEVRTAIRRLVDASLVVADTVVTPSRYHLLETVRDFAAEGLERTGVSGARRQQFAEGMADSAIRLGARSRGPDESDAVRAVLDSLDNFREAFRWAVSQGRAEVALTIATELWDVAKWTDTHEILGWAELASRMPGADASARGATALACRAELALMSGEFAIAAHLADAALAAQPPPNRPSLAHFVHQGIAMFDGHRDAVSAASHRLVEVAEATGYHVDALAGRIAPYIDFRIDHLPMVSAIAMDARSFGNAAARWLPMTVHAWILVTRLHDDVGLDELDEIVELSDSCAYRTLSTRARHNLCAARLMLDVPVDDLLQPMQRSLEYLRATDDELEIATAAMILGWAAISTGALTTGARLLGFGLDRPNRFPPAECDRIRRLVKSRISPDLMTALDRGLVEGANELDGASALALARSVW